jgi:hypothetical protein
MIARAAFWYVFGLAAVVLLLYRLRPTRRVNLRDPMALSFTLMVFVAASGTLSKQPFIANAIDSLLGPNAAWLQADILFIAGMCAGTVWIDLLGQPALKQRGWRLFLQWRVAVLTIVAAWMITAAQLEAPTWAALERGTVDVGGSLILASARSGYFAFSIWVLAYISYGLYHHRQQVRSREIYVRLTIPFTGLALAPSASVIQLLAVWYGLAWPELVPAVWPSLWVVIATIQVRVMILILSAFLSPAYRAVIWVDKQWLVRRLGKACEKIRRTQPDLVVTPKPGKALIINKPDVILADLVNRVERIKHLAGSVEGGPIEAPAGSVMLAEDRNALRNERGVFSQLLAGEKVTFARVTGEVYALARWYVAAVY